MLQNLGRGLSPASNGGAPTPPTPSAPVNTVAPVVTGGPLVGQSLATSDGNWTGFPVPVYSYQWRRSGVDIAGATNNAYTLVTADDGEAIDCVVTASNSEGNADADSNDINAGTVPVNTAAPVASGTGEVGATLSVTNGTWTGTAPITYTYQWRRDAVNIAGANSSTYTLVSADEGTDIDCLVTATNGFGGDSADSNDIQNIAAGGGSYLDGVVTSAVCELDATVSDSYSGSGQTWANLVASPADGSAQADYDFTLGANDTASTDDPTFTGTAGDSGAYWSVDSGDNFTLAGDNTAFINSLHKGSQAFWICVIWRNVDLTWRNGPLVGTAIDNFNPDDGLHLGTTSSERYVINQGGGGVETSNTSPAYGGSDFGDDQLVIVSYDGNGMLRWWRQSATSQSSAFVMAASTQDAEAKLRLHVDEWGRTSDMSRLYHVSMGNEYLDDTKAAAIIAHLEARHGRDYTP